MKNKTGIWVVMTSMKRGIPFRYRNVALVKIDRDMYEENKRPKMISERAKGVQQVIHLGHHNVGAAKRSAYAKVMEEAEKRAAELNEGKRNA